MSKATTQVMINLKVSENNITSLNQIPAHFTDSFCIYFLASVTSKTGDTLIIYFCGENKEKTEKDYLYIVQFFLILS